MRRPNILFSTTRTWNPGDDFILYGILNLFSTMLKGFNPVIHNRNPDISQLKLAFNHKATLNWEEYGDARPINFYQVLRSSLKDYDNSWQKSNDMSCIDMIVFAGSPEWLSVMVEELAAAGLKRDVPILYLGIGAFELTTDINLEQLSKVDQDMLKKAKLIITRDSITQKIVAPLESHFLPCPALFSATTNQVRESKNKIALTLQNHNPKQYQDIPEDLFNVAMSGFKQLEKNHDCSMIWHYYNELEMLSSKFPEIPNYYSYDPRDYYDIYSQFDLLVTTRVHGAGIAASMGIPSIVLSHSTRSETTKGFLADIIDLTEVGEEALLKTVGDFDVKQRSEQLIEHKKKTEKDYQKLLKPIFEEIFPEQVK